MRLTIVILMLFWMCCRTAAQSIIIDDFKQLKKIPVLQSGKFATDKHNAILDFLTSVKGLGFVADGRQEVAANDIDGGVSLIVPDGTSFLKITHPQYGTMIWKVPKGKLKKKHHYQATLTAFDPENEYKLQSQWAIFDITPKDAVLYVDSAMYLIRNGYKELSLPLGSHTYRLESPFHQALTDTFSITDTEVKKINLTLMPEYSYLSVTAPMTIIEILIDGQYVGKGTATSQRLEPGHHTVSLRVNGTTCYSDVVTVGTAEKQNITIELDQLAMISSVDITAHLEKLKQKGVSADVHIVSADSTAQIYMNRELLAEREWQGRLPAGQYALTTRTDGMESGVTWVVVSDTIAQEIIMPVSASAYGYVSVSCDIPGAEVLVDGTSVGTAPLVINKVDATRSHEIRLRKEGYEDGVKIITPDRNQLTEVPFALKKKKKDKSSSNH